MVEPEAQPVDPIACAAATQIVGLRDTFTHDRIFRLNFGGGEIGVVEEVRCCGSTRILHVRHIAMHSEVLRGSPFPG